jgi:ankyrin repeat protein
MSLTQAVARLRDGDIAYFDVMSSEDLMKLAVEKDDDGRSGLHTAAAHGHFELCDKLASANPNAVNAEDEGGWTPILSASSSGHTQVVHCLVKAGANVNVSNSALRTPLHYAASKGHEHVIRLLIDAGVCLN